MRGGAYTSECISRLVTEENARPPLSLVAFPSSLSSLACTRELSSLAANGVTPGSGNAIHEGLCNDTDAGGTSVLTSLDDNTTRNESSMRADCERTRNYSLVESVGQLSNSFVVSNRISIPLVDSKYFDVVRIHNH